MKYSTDIVVLDLEAMCRTEGNNEVQNSNIIEIRAVRLDRRTLEVTATFSELVRPRDIPVSRCQSRSRYPAVLPFGSRVSGCKRKSVDDSSRV